MPYLTQPNRAAPYHATPLIDVPYRATPRRDEYKQCYIVIHL